MQIITRSNKKEKLSLDKIKHKITFLINSFNLDLDENYIDNLTLQVINSIYDGITTKELDEETARISSTDINNLDAQKLASIVSIHSFHKDSLDSFSDKVEILYQNNIINKNFFDFSMKHKDIIQKEINYELDYNIDFFGFKTLKNGYLLKIKKDGEEITIERPQDLFMREAISIHIGDIDKVLENYHKLSKGYFTHATPTLFNAGTHSEQYSSCYLLQSGDSVEKIYKNISDCAKISQYAGGIGVHLSMIRSAGSSVNSTNGRAGGIPPILKVLNETARHINQSGKRPGSIAIYLEPHHNDIFEFLKMKVNDGGKDELKARDLFYALWISDLFMKKVKNDEDWYLMCPFESPRLNEVYGEEFENLYNKYVNEGKYKRVIKAQALWKKIIDTQIGTGTPYMCYKDAVNRKTNQKNIGVIKSSNLCVAPETFILTDQGYKQIKNLENTKVKVWNGEEWSETTVYKTGVNKNLMKIYFNNYLSIQCTDEHKFYIKGKKEPIPAKDLKEDMELQTSYFPFINNKLLFDNLKKILDEGYYIGEELIIQSDYLSFLKKIKYNLNVLGCDASIKFEEDMYRLRIKYDHILFLQKKFNTFLNYCTEAKFRYHIPYPEPEKVIVTLVKQTERFDDTYCFNEPYKHKGVFNGILTGQCSEIMEYSDDYETANCNLASIALPIFYEKDGDGGKFNYNLLREITHNVVENLNNVIDKCFYPTPETKTSNMRHRPIGIGVQGLSHLYMKMKIPFESEEARKVNRQVFETIYFSALEKSNELAKKQCYYYTFEGSPLSKGLFQFDLWKQENEDVDIQLSGMWDWETLREDIKKYGVRNSLVTTCMPTASTSQILGNSESIDPLTSNMYSRRVSSGEYIVMNKYLVEDIKKYGKWNKNTKDILQYDEGSVKNISFLPGNIKEVYKTVWEIPQKELINQSADRGLFIDQSQSLNLFMNDPIPKKISSMHFYAWSKGLKTGMYYLRQKSRTKSSQITVDVDKVKESISCSMDDRENCEACSS